MLMIQLMMMSIRFRLNVVDADDDADDAADDDVNKIQLVTVFASLCFEAFWRPYLKCFSVASPCRTTTSWITFTTCSPANGAISIMIGITCKDRMSSVETIEISSLIGWSISAPMSRLLLYI